MDAYRISGRYTHITRVVPLWWVAAALLGHRFITVGLAILLDVAEPCYVDSCRAEVQVLLWLYRFMAGS